MDDEHLIEQVRHYEELYDMADRRYSDNEHKTNVWEKIGKELNKSGSECKTRWVSLRDQLRKAIKKKKTKSGQGVEHLKKWKFEDFMTFVIPFLKERETRSNIHASDILDEGQESSSLGDLEERRDVNPNNDPIVVVTENETLSKNRDAPSLKEKPKSRPCPSRNRWKTSESASSVLMKYLIESDKEKSEISTPISAIHPIDAFFNGLAATVKQFSPFYQNLAKSKIFGVVSDLELAQIQQPLNYYTFQQHRAAPSNSNSEPFIGTPIPSGGPTPVNNLLQQYHTLPLHSNAPSPSESSQHFRATTSASSYGGTPIPSPSGGPDSIPNYVQQFSLGNE